MIYIFLQLSLLVGEAISVEGLTSLAATAAAAGSAAAVAAPSCYLSWPSSQP